MLPGWRSEELVCLYLLTKRSLAVYLTPTRSVHDPVRCIIPLNFMS